MSHPSRQSGSYILRRLLGDIPLAPDADTTDVRITCVEAWHQNLYIGTSAAEILHFVLIPPEPTDALAPPTVILASRLQPTHHGAHAAGVQQILLLPRAGKACILCNHTLTFYSLPELSPAFAATKPLTCAWVGGVDQNLDPADDAADDGAVIMLCLKSRIRLVRLGAEPRRIRDIEFGGCLATARRDTFACAADAHSYALLDVVHQQKIPLFPISSLDDAAATTTTGGAEDLSPSAHAPSRSVSSASTHERLATRDTPGHGRSTSLGTFARGSDAPRPDSARATSGSGPRFGFDAPASLSRMQSPPPPARPLTADTSAPPAPPALAVPTHDRPSASFTPLPPHIASPTPTEFLLTTGTTPSDRGVGMFVNLDGDVSRGTIEFTAYPDHLVVDGAGADGEGSAPSGSGDGFVLAVIRRLVDGDERRGVEIQPVDVDPSEGDHPREWLDLGPLDDRADDKVQSTIGRPLGIGQVLSPMAVGLPEIGDQLSLRRLHVDPDAPSDPAASDRTRETARETEETAITSRLCTVHTRVLLWAGDQIWWMVRAPAIVHLDARLSTPPGAVSPTRAPIERLLHEIRGRDSSTESEYLGLAYIRQKASLLLLMDLVRRTRSGDRAPDHETATTTDALLDSGVDPRVVLSLLPILRDEISPGPQGIWVQGGLRDTVATFLRSHDDPALPTDVTGPWGANLLHPIKRFLTAWRQKKGLPSIGDETEVFATVDAALLRLLLLLDARTPPGPAAPGSIRAELNGVVDGGVDCFDRAVAMLEHAQRPYVLSRLYQSRKLAPLVLATWRRIAEGAPDRGGELTDADLKIRRHLGEIRDPAIVQEYALWLARRQPALGVQVFADDASRVRFRPAHALALLTQHAPAAVPALLEHLVFVKKLPEYANDLIAFYLDAVLHELDASPPSREVLAHTYETYRALAPPKPTYGQFLAENGLDAPWWRHRLRLLQLLGRAPDATAAYDAAAIRARLAPYERELVPEMIILHGRQGEHAQAIRLLTHGLGDLDTATRYCLLGGSSIFPSGSVPRHALPSRDDQSRLFGSLLREFLRLADPADRVQRTGELLERFGGWFDAAEVLRVIPDTWSIDVFSEFLVHALRRLARDRSDTTVTKALHSAHNLQTSSVLVDRVVRVGPTVETVP